MSESRRYNHDRERVVTDDLAVVLERFIENWNRERPRGQIAEKFSADVSEIYSFVGAMDYLSTRSGVGERRIWGIIKRETFTTSFWMADALLTAINLDWKLANGEIREVPEWVETRGSRRADNGTGVTSTKKFQSQEEWLEYLDRIGCRR